MLSYNRHCGFSILSLCIYSKPGLGCHAAREHREQWLQCGTLGGGGAEEKVRQTEESEGLHGYRERLVLCERERVKKERHRKSERDTGELEREGAAASLQSGSWPPSSSAEHSLALGEEERVETLLRPFIGSHSSAGGCGSGTNISGKQLSPVGVQIASYNRANLLFCFSPRFTALQDT